MKNVLLAVFSLFLFSTFAAADWTALDSTTTEPLFDVDFVDGSHGWAVGGPGIGFPTFPSSVVLKTTNAGDNWTNVPVPSDNQMHGVCFVDRNTGWIVGQGGEVLKTSNGGDDWEVQPLDFYLIGRAWPFFNAVACIDENTAYAVGSNGVVARTLDGGDTWLNVSGDFEGSGPTYEDVYFTDASHGWAVGGNGTVIFTTNGGSTWTTRYLRTAGLFSVFFLNNTRGWAGGSSGELFSTTDGGLTWANTSLDYPVGTRGIYFVNETHGWLVGPILRFTNNSGQNWYIDSSEGDSGEPFHNLPSTLRGIDFGGSTGWIAGDDGVILRLGEPSNGGLRGVLREPNFTVYAANRTQICQSDLGECVDSINRTCTFVASLPTAEQVSQCRAREETECNDNYAACLAEGEEEPGEESGGEQGEVQSGEAGQEEQAEQTGQEGAGGGGEQSEPQQMQSSFNPVQSVVAVFQGVVNWFAALFGG